MLEFICALQSEHLTPGEALPRARAQSPAADRQRFLQLAGAPVPAHGQAPAGCPIRRDVGEVLADDHTMQDERLDGVPAAGERAHARLRRRRAVRRRAASPAGWRGSKPARAARRRARAAALPAAGARDAGQRGLHQLRARGPACRAAAEGGARRRRRHAPGSTWTGSKAATTTTARSSGNIARCSLLHSGRLGARRSAGSRRYFRREWSYAVDRARNIADGARVHPAGLHRRHRRGRGAACRSKFKALHYHAPAGRRADRPSSRAGSQDLLSARTSRHDSRPMPAADTCRLRPHCRRASNPWLGLASFTEETRACFYGRDEEVAELARRVQRKLLTVLFGQSGLGKTSILRAGLVPRLRAEGYCPVYVRIDYSPDSPSAVRADQAGDLPRDRGRGPLDAARHRAVEGESLVGVPASPRRPAARRDAAQTLHAAADLRPVRGDLHAGARRRRRPSARAAQFLDDLADLVENRPPAALEAPSRAGRCRRRAVRLRARRLPRS